MQGDPSRNTLSLTEVLERLKRGEEISKQDLEESIKTHCNENQTLKDEKAVLQDKMVKFNEQLQKKDVTIVELIAQHNVDREVIDSQQSQLKEKDEIMVKQQSQLKEKDEMLANQQRVNTERMMMFEADKESQLQRAAQEKADLNSQLQRATQEKADLNSQLQHVTKENQILQESLEENTKVIADQATTIFNMKSQLQCVSQEKTDLESQLQRVTQEKDEIIAKRDSDIRVAHEEGGQAMKTCIVNEMVQSAKDLIKSKVKTNITKFNFLCNYVDTRGNVNGDGNVDGDDNGKNNYLTNYTKRDVEVIVMVEGIN